MQGRRRHFGDIVIIGLAVAMVGTLAGFAPPTPLSRASVTIAQAQPGMTASEVANMNARFDSIENTLRWQWLMLAGSAGSGAAAGGFFGLRRRHTSHPATSTTPAQPTRTARSTHHES